MEREKNCSRNNNKTAMENRAAELVRGCKSISEGAI